MFAQCWAVLPDSMCERACICKITYILECEFSFVIFLDFFFCLHLYTIGILFYKECVVLWKLSSYLESIEQSIKAFHVG